jgi:hypothetical protein
MHPLFLWVYAPAILLGFMYLFPSYLGLRTRFFSGFMHPLSYLGLRTHYSLWVHAPVILSGFMHPLFLWVYAPVILFGFTYPLFYLGFTHPLSYLVYTPSILRGFIHPHFIVLGCYPHLGRHDLNGCSVLHTLSPTKLYHWHSPLCFGLHTLSST